MKKLNIWIGFFFCLFITATAAPADSPIFDVPRVNGINVDGDSADWSDSGFRVGIITGEDGSILPADDLNADFHLGWDDRGLLLILAVDDDVAVESQEDTALWQGDSVELFVATKQGAPVYYQVVISSGLDPKYPDLRKMLHDYREDSSAGEITADVARAKTETGYMLEAMLPWSNLSIEPEEGDEIGFQLYVTDSDDASEPFKVIWYPRSGTHDDSSAMHRLRLAAKPSPAVLASVKGDYELMKRVRIRVNATTELIGKEVKVTDDDVTLVTGELAADKGRAGADLVIPMLAPGKSYGELAVFVGDSVIDTLTLPDPDQQRARALVDAGIHFQPSVFTGTEFPSCDFERPLWGEALIGQYKIKTTFYDNEYNEVTLAEKPGRYGAIIEITPEQGKVIRRFRTLFRQPDDVNWWLRDVPFSVELPKEMGIDPAVVEEQVDSISYHLRWRLVDGFQRDDGSASLLAGLYETEPGKGKITVANNVLAEDREWWVGLKRKFYGTDKSYPEPFVCPNPFEGEPAPMLREGTLAEAGMKPDAVDRIDAVCQEWAADSDQSFAVCIVRHGVIVLHKAYGERDGRPMTVDDRSWMASITKLLSGTLMMKLVDKGLVDLDDRVDKFIPALRSIDVKTPLTIRHLYTHTNGLWGHWGDDLHDFEEIIADYYPHLEVGVRHSYNGAGYTMGGKVIETITGEAIPQFYKRHLLDPLGCTNTYVADTSGGSFSIPLDMAKIGQMLLNKGKYGDKQFFSEETFEKMLPIKLTKVLGPETNIEWGIGATWYKDPGLGEGTFAHGAASAATLRIDPVNDLVIVMTRNWAGSNFGKYHPLFIAAIVDGLETSTPGD